jgi:nicotinate (nicotinamide) nucleotide adenylyltransferase
MASGSGFVEISDVELSKDGWSRTIDTLEFLRGGNPGARVFLLCGIDVVESFEKHWRQPDIERILVEFGLVVLPRNDTVIKSIEDHSVWLVGKALDNIVICDSNPLALVSSSLVRKLLASKKHISGLVAPGVEEYIRTNGLFLGQIAPEEKEGGK